MLSDWLIAFAQAVGEDVKELKARVPGGASSAGRVPFFSADGVQKNMALNADGCVPFVTAAGATTSIKLVQ